MNILIVEDEQKTDDYLKQGSSEDDFVNGLVGYLNKLLLNISE